MFNDLWIQTGRLLSRASVIRSTDLATVLNSPAYESQYAFMNAYMWDSLFGGLLQELNDQHMTHSIDFSMRDWASWRD
jgi:hypothetical protein